MRSAVLITFLLLFAACDNCPDGNASDSVYCHAASCATGESVCSGACSNLQSDRDNCGSCGNACGDGLVCSLGMCVEGCDNGLASCAGACVDLATDKDNCGGCGIDDSSHVCTPDQTCNSGVCGCGPNDVVCNGACVDPATSQNFCGASGTCAAGVSAGKACTNEEACVAGTCTSKLIYRGSLPASNGRWMYQATLGLDGANADCEAHWPGSAICPYDKLLAASLKATPETINATDYNGTAVATWWVDDPNQGSNNRCTKNADNIPWSYGTQDEGHVGTSVLLTPATGAISALRLDNLPSCNQPRAVPCCSLVTAP